MVAALSDLYPFVLPDVPGCPTPLVDKAIRNTVIDFCEDTRAWRADLAALDIVTDQALYTLIPLAETRVITLVYVAHEDYPLTAKSEDQLDREWPRLNYAYAYESHYTEQGTPWRQVKDAQATYYYQPARHTLRLVPIPDTSKVGALRVRAALKPTPTANTFSQEVFDDYYQVLAAGALYHLQTMPGKDWSDGNAAALNVQRYREGKTMARGDLYRSHADHHQSVGHTTIQDHF